MQGWPIGGVVFCSDGIVLGGHRLKLELKWVLDTIFFENHSN